jgi:hypothetical protein
MPETNLVILSEADLELGIDYTTNLALSPGSDKRLTLTFPSSRLMEIFMENLFLSFTVNQVPRDNNLDLVLNIPEEGQNGTRLQSGS